jgi:hypothetical protein
MARRIAAESLEMFGIGGQVGNAGIYGSARVSSIPQGYDGAIRAKVRRRAQTFLDQVLELATTQRRLRLGPPVELV